MRGLDKLQALKESMLAPLFEKRRHLGCEICGHTFYGYYQKKGWSNVETGKVIPHDTKEGWFHIETYDDVFYPDCPKCGIPTVCDVKEARAQYEQAKEEGRKRAERRKARKAKRDARPVVCSRKLRFDNWPSFQERLQAVSLNPDLLTAHELHCSWFLDKLFWNIFGKGCHTMSCRHWSVRKRLYDGTYKSNSGKSTMGDWVPHFEITNTITGKIHKVGDDEVISYIDMKREYGTNRRNDPRRNYGLPNSRGYR